MKEELILSAASQQPAHFPHTDYTMALLQYAALHHSIEESKLNEIRNEMQRIAAERAYAFSSGKCSAVTRRQAESLFACLFCQLDAALLEMHSDELAMEALRTQPLSRLLEAGLMRSLDLYTKAKEHFRHAYLRMKPFQTAFFSGLLPDFEKFCTQYDARFQSGDSEIGFTYPLFGEKPVAEKGILGIFRYYQSLDYEADILCCFPSEAVQAFMKRYAKLYLTSPAAIAENIAELVFRHHITSLLAGDTACTPDVTSKQIADVEALYLHSTPQQLLSDIETAIQNQPYMQSETSCRYLKQVLPGLADAMFNRIQRNAFSGWFAHCKD
ncbi:MAG: DUF6179 domain-containing protein [Oscillospiraceae bacterium]|nr:DUF6179 domain-containing protein [Oscillospiraceae bacterium]